MANFFFEQKDGYVVGLDTNVTRDLYFKMLMRELNHAISEWRKTANLDIQAKINIEWASNNEILKEMFNKYGNILIENTIAFPLTEFKLGNEEDLNNALVIVYFENKSKFFQLTYKKDLND